MKNALLISIALSAVSSIAMAEPADKTPDAAPAVMQVSVTSGKQAGSVLPEANVHARAAKPHQATREEVRAEYIQWRKDLRTGAATNPWGDTSL